MGIAVAIIAFLMEVVEDGAKFVIIEQMENIIKKGKEEKDSDIA